MALKSYSIALALWREDTSEWRSLLQRFLLAKNALLIDLSSVYFTRIPKVLPTIFPGFTWRGFGTAVHLTFDDGPHPEWTPFVLDELGERGQKGTFFCVGKNILKYPELFNRIRSEGHTWGNHTMRHESGWSTSQKTYLRSYLECQELTQSDLFRPPYGRLTPAQAKAISRRSQVVMWTLLTGDFDVRRQPEECLRKTLRTMRPGDIVVMHETEKSAPRLAHVLPGLLDFLDAKGWRSEALAMSSTKASEELQNHIRQRDFCI